MRLCNLLCYVTTWPAATTPDSPSRPRAQTPPADPAPLPSPQSHTLHDPTRDTPAPQRRPPAAATPTLAPAPAPPRRLPRRPAMPPYPRAHTSLAPRQTLQTPAPAPTRHAPWA